MRCAPSPWEIFQAAVEHGEAGCGKKHEKRQWRGKARKRWRRVRGDGASAPSGRPGLDGRVARASSRCGLLPIRVSIGEEMGGGSSERAPVGAWVGWASGAGGRETTWCVRRATSGEEGVRHGELSQALHDRTDGRRKRRPAACGVEGAARRFLATWTSCTCQARTSWAARRSV